MNSYRPTWTSISSLEEDPEALRKIFILKLFVMLGMLFSLPFGVLSLFQDNYILSLFLLSTSAILTINYYLVVNKQTYKLSAHIMVYLFFVLYIYLVYSGGVENTGSLWIYIFPSLALFLHGLKHGLVDISIFVILIALMFLVNNGNYLEVTYTDEYKIRLLLSFFIVALLSSSYEYSSTKSFVQMRLLTKKLIDNAKQEQLTELANKRGIYEEMELLFHYAKKHDETLSIMLCDIDYLHDINGRYGLDVGNMVIKEIEQEIQNSIKNSGTVARWSGEEFLILLPQTKLNDAYKFSVALEKRIKNLSIMHDRKPIQVSLTTGVSDIENTKSIYSAIRQADNKMYNVI